MLDSCFTVWLYLASLIVGKKDALSLVLMTFPRVLFWFRNVGHVNRNHCPIY